jgi:phosphoglycerol transferase MdoB-like AlkP superfamily enzyme
MKDYLRKLINWGMYDGIEKPVEYALSRAAAIFILLSLVKANEVLILAHGNLSSLLEYGRMLKTYYIVFVYQDFVFSLFLFASLVLYVRILKGRITLASTTVYITLLLLSAYAAINLEFFRVFKDVFDFTYYSGDFFRLSFWKTNFSSIAEVASPTGLAIKFVFLASLMLVLPQLLRKLFSLLSRIDRKVSYSLGFIIFCYVLVSSAVAHLLYAEYPYFFERLGDFTVFEKNIYFALVKSYFLVFSGDEASSESIDYTLFGFNLSEYAFTDPSRPMAKEALEGRSGGVRNLNVVVVILESFRADSIEVYGGPVKNTPNMKRLENNSMLFKRFYVNSPLSANSLPTLLCSVYPYPNHKKIVLKKPHLKSLCLPDVLKSCGYGTAFYYSGYLDYYNEGDFIENRGFDLFYTAYNISEREHVKTTSWGFDDFSLLKPSFTWIDSQGGRPFLIFYYTTSTHHPFGVPPGNAVYGSEDLSERYNSAIHYTDKFVGEVYDNLGKRGLLNNTLIVLVGDHGQRITEEVDYKMYYPSEENIHVPLIIVDSGRISEKEVSSRPGSMVDLVPTLLDLMGISVLNPFQGESLLKEINETIYITSSHGEYDGAIEGDIKVVYNTNRNTISVFNLSAGEEPIENQQYPANVDTILLRVKRWAALQNYLLDKEMIW